MAIESKFKRVADDSPIRCQGKFAFGQCPYEKTPGSEYCQMHGGQIAVNKAAKADLRMYRIAKWQSRINEVADHEGVKSLREEIGILRVIMEETMGMCNDSSTLLLYSSKISDTAMKLEKLISSCHRLEASTGVLLDKQAALQIASTIVEIIGRYVTDEDAVNAVAEEVIAVILNTKSETKA